MTTRSRSMISSRFAALSLATAFLAASCTENAPPKSNLNDKAIVPAGISLTQVSPGVVSVTDPGNVSGAPTAVGPAPTEARGLRPKDDVVVPPPDAKWTIACAVVGGPGHTTRAKQFKDQLTAATHSNKWYVVHEDDKSTIYHGFYRAIDRGSKDGDVAQSERLSIAGMKNASGDTPMQLCTFMQIDHAAPDAPAEWDLGNYTRGPRQFWSLQIAAYTADATDQEGHDRKWAAVESVKAMRGQGIPAYFSHGETVSSVCVGIWPEDSVKRQSGGNDKGSASAENPEQGILVSTAPLPASMPPPKDADGHLLKTVVPRVEILDRDMHAMMTKFSTHMINSEERLHEVLNPRTGQKERVPEPSFLVLLPEKKQQPVAAGIPRPPADTGPLPNLPPALLQLDNAQQPGVHKLREIGQ